MDDIVFVGDWVKDRVLGSGSFGVVVLWKHKRTDERLAIKTCKWGAELQEKHRERWTKEVEMLRGCSNANIVGTRELPSEFVAGLARANPSNLPILCMEYCSGGDLRQLLNKPEACSGLRELQVRQVLADVRNAMDFLHRCKITHRDLKPENIVMQLTESAGQSELVGSTTRKVVYKLIDLGYAKEIDSKSVCASFVGTLQYLAPEIMYSKTYSNSVDYWSLGLVAFEIICGTRPFLPNMAPVQWMPHIRKKTSDSICVYETFHGDIEYSSEIFPENHVTQSFKSLIEKWLRVALEWEPKLRGRDAPSKVTFNLPTEEKESSSKIVIFDLLEEILNKKILKLFAMPTLSHYDYVIDESTTGSSLKSSIKNDLKIPIEDQILISQATHTELNNDELVIKYWNDQCVICFYLYEKTSIIRNQIECFVPKPVQRSLEHPKSLYNFNNSQNLYKCSFYFIMREMEIFDALINGVYVRSESLKQESKQLLLKHITVDKSIGKLLAKQETVMKFISTGKLHVQSLKDNGSGTNFLGGFEKIFKDADDFSEKVNKLQSAWTQLTVRLQSAARRSNEILSGDLNNFVSKNNYQSIYISAQKAFIFYRKNEREFRVKERQCHDIMKICYDCLKLRNKILTEIRHQSFMLKLLDLSVEFVKISGIISAAADNVEKLDEHLNTATDELAQCLWSTVSLLSADEPGLADLPYSVVSFQKRDFKIGEPVTLNGTESNKFDDELSSLLLEHVKLKQNTNSLTDKLKMQHKLMKESEFDFNFLDSEE